AVFIDEGQIEQAIVNVLTNSVQAIGPEEGSIHISVRQTELVDVTQSDGGVADSGSFWCIVIRDDGPGIDADVLSHIFEPFYTTRESSGGCGMGLATCQSVVELHGGILEVSSEQNLGAEFRMFLPAHRQDSRSALLPPPVPERFEGSILLVDDEELVLRASQRLLIGLGARVEACSSPADALERVQAAPGQYDVVITDLTMPELLGTQLAEKINRVAPNLPILLLTGNRGRIDPESLERVKLVGIIEKPLSLRETSEALGRLIPVNQDSPATSD
ncbi:MAG: ATP-binding protein, partial [Myxococcota bacterium]